MMDLFDKLHKKDKGKGQYVDDKSQTVVVEFYFDSSYIPISCFIGVYILMYDF